MIHLAHKNGLMDAISKNLYWISIIYFATISPKYMVMFILDEYNSIISGFRVCIKCLHADSILINRVKQFPFSHSDQRRQIISNYLSLTFSDNCWKFFDYWLKLRNRLRNYKVLLILLKGYFVSFYWSTLLIANSDYSH
jgi:hypothetical protein